MAETFETPMLGPTQTSLIDAKQPHRFPCNGDWQLHRLVRVLTPEECAAVCLPIEIYPEDKDYVPA